MSSLKIAIVGLGVIGNVHAAALKEQGKAVYAVCDIDPGRLLSFPGALHFTDYETMLEEAKPDAVHICTPHYLHASMIMAFSALSSVWEQISPPSARARMVFSSSSERLPCGT